MKKFFTTLATTLCLTTVLGSTHAEKFTVTGLVDDILINERSFGVCAVAIEGWSAPGSCGAKWISLDCSGDYIDKSVARAMLETTQIAKATGSQVSVVADGKRRHNGRCIATQIILR